MERSATARWRHRPRKTLPRRVFTCRKFLLVMSCGWRKIYEERAACSTFLAQIRPKISQRWVFIHFAKIILSWWKDLRAELFLWSFFVTQQVKTLSGDIICATMFLLCLGRGWKRHGTIFESDERARCRAARVNGHNGHWLWKRAQDESADDVCEQWALCEWNTTSMNHSQREILAHKKVLKIQKKNKIFHRRAIYSENS